MVVLENSPMGCTQRFRERRFGINPRNRWQYVSLPCRYLLKGYRNDMIPCHCHFGHGLSHKLPDSSVDNTNLARFEMSPKAYGSSLQATLAKAVFSRSQRQTRKSPRSQASLDTTLPPLHAATMGCQDWMTDSDTLHISTTCT